MNKFNRDLQNYAEQQFKIIQNMRQNKISSAKLDIYERIHELSVKGDQECPEYNSLIRWIQSLASNEPIISYEIFWITLFDRSSHMTFLTKKINKTLHFAQEELKEILNKMDQSRMGQIFKNIKFVTLDQNTKEDKEKQLSINYLSKYVYDLSFIEKYTEDFVNNIKTYNSMIRSLLSEKIESITSSNVQKVFKIITNYENDSLNPNFLIKDEKIDSNYLLQQEYIQMEQRLQKLGYFKEIVQEKFNNFIEEFSYKTSETQKENIFLCSFENKKLNFNLKINEIKTLNYCNELIENSYNIKELSESIKQAEKNKFYQFSQFINLFSATLILEGIYDFIKFWDFIEKKCKESSQGDEVKIQNITNQFEKYVQNISSQNFDKTQSHIMVIILWIKCDSEEQCEQLELKVHIANLIEIENMHTKYEFAMQDYQKNNDIFVEVLQAVEQLDSYKFSENAIKIVENYNLINLLINKLLVYKPERYSPLVNSKNFNDINDQFNNYITCNNNQNHNYINVIIKKIIPANNIYDVMRQYNEKIIYHFLVPEQDNIIFMCYQNSIHILNKVNYVQTTFISFEVEVKCLATTEGLFFVGTDDQGIKAYDTSHFLPSSQMDQSDIKNVRSMIIHKGKLVVHGKSCLTIFDIQKYSLVKLEEIIIEGLNCICIDKSADFKYEHRFHNVNIKLMGLRESFIFAGSTKGLDIYTMTDFTKYTNEAIIMPEVKNIEAIIVNTYHDIIALINNDTGIEVYTIKDNITHRTSFERKNYQIYCYQQDNMNNTIQISSQNYGFEIISIQNKNTRVIQEISSLTSIGIDQTNQRVIISSNERGLSELNLHNYFIMDHFNEFQVSKAQNFQLVSAKNILVITSDVGIHTYDLNNGKKVDRLCKRFVQVTFVHAEASGEQIFVASQRGLNCINFSDGECKLISDLNMVTCIYTTSTSIWVASVKGLIQIDFKDWKETLQFKKEQRRSKKVQILQDNLQLLTDSQFLKIKLKGMKLVFNVDLVESKNFWVKKVKNDFLVQITHIKGIICVTDKDGSMKKEFCEFLLNPIKDIHVNSFNNIVQQITDIGITLIDIDTAKKIPIPEILNGISVKNLYQNESTGNLILFHSEGMYVIFKDKIFQQLDIKLDYALIDNTNYQIQYLDTMKKQMLRNYENRNQY